MLVSVLRGMCEYQWGGVAVKFDRNPMLLSSQDVVEDDY